jgi:hypothetical protein
VQKVDFEELIKQKREKSCQMLLFGFVPLEREASIAKAAWKAEIKHVTYVETSYENFLPLMRNKCVIVYGK